MRKNRTYEEIDAELEKLFDPDTTPFRLYYRPSSDVLYYHNFPGKGLRIVVTTPLFYKGFDKYEIKKGLHVKFEVYFHDKCCLEFTDSRITKGWEKVAAEKLATLMELISLAPSCPTCGSFMLTNKGKDFQVNPRGTEFVWYSCVIPKCSTNVPTPFRTATRLKTKVARFLKKAA